MSKEQMDELVALDISPRFYIDDGGGIHAGVLEDTQISDLMPSANIVSGSVNSYLHNVPVELRDDINNCVLLAQFAADSLHARSFPSRDWYEEFERWLKICGWTIQGKALQRVGKDHKEFKVHNAIIKFMAAAGGAAILPIVEAALKSLDEMDSDSDLITLFESESSFNGKGAFQIAGVTPNGEGLAAITLGQFTYEATEVKKKFLFFPWSEDAINMMASVSQCTFTSSGYAPVKQVVEEKLAPYRVSAIKNLEINLGA